MYIGARHPLIWIIPISFKELTRDDCESWLQKSLHVPERLCIYFKSDQVRQIQGVSVMLVCVWRTVRGAKDGWQWQVK